MAQGTGGEARDELIRIVDDMAGDAGGDGAATPHVAGDAQVDGADGAGGDDVATSRVARVAGVRSARLPRLLGAMAVAALPLAATPLAAPPVVGVSIGALGAASSASDALFGPSDAKLAARARAEAKARAAEAPRHPSDVDIERERAEHARLMATRQSPDAMTEAQRAVVASARSVGQAGPGMCLAWVNDVFDDAGYGFERVWAASEACQLWCGSTDRSALRPGMIVAVESTETSPYAGHIGIYVGNGCVMDNETLGGEGVVKERALDEWLGMFGKVAEPRWGWAGGVDLSTGDAEPHAPIGWADGDEEDGAGAEG